MNIPRFTDCLSQDEIGQIRVFCDDVIYLSRDDILHSGRIEYVIQRLEICVVPLKYST